MTIADSADAYIKRETLHRSMSAFFHDHRPDDRDLATVATLAEVVIDVVFAARAITDPGEQDARYSDAKDYAECGSLWGFVLGYAYAAQRLGQSRVS